MNGALARRYAKAVFAIASERGQVEELGRELATLAETFRAPEVARLAEGGALGREPRRRLAEAVAAAAGAGALARQFLGVLAENNRLGVLVPAAREYERLSDRAFGRVRARVRSAAALAPDTLAAIDEAFSKRTGKSVIAEVEVEPELLGGIVVEVQGRIYDGSLRTRVERLRQTLVG